MTNLTFKKNKIFYHTLFVISLPIIIQNLISSSLHVVDNMMIGQLNEASITAVGLANLVSFTLALFLFGANSGTSIFVAQFWGKGDEKRIRLVVAIGLIISLSTATVFFLLSFFGTDLLMNFFSNDPTVIALGTSYLKIISPTFLLLGVVFPLTFSTRSIGKPKLGLYASMISLGLNTVLNYILIFGTFGMPALGVSGAAIATLISRIVELIIVVVVVYRSIPVVQVRWKHFSTIPSDLFQKVMKKTLPVILNEGLWSLGMSAMTVIYSHMSTNESAAYLVAQTILSLFSVLSIGTGNAAAVMLGNQLGEGNRETAIDYNKKLLILNVSAGIITGGILYFVAAPIVYHLYNLSPEVSANAIWCIRMIGFALPFKFYNMVMIVGTFRSGGDTVFSLILEAGSVWMLGVPLTYLAGIIIGFPVYWVVLISNIEEMFKMLAGLKRVLSGRWANILS